MKNTTDTKTGSTNSGCTRMPTILPEKTRGRLRRAKKVQIDRQQHRDGSCWRGHAGKELRGKGRLVRIVHRCIEASEPQAPADRKDHCRDPAHILEVVQLPEIEDQAGGDTEIDKVGEAVEFSAEFRLALDNAGHTAANTIAPTASSIRPSVESRIAVRPAQIASSVMKLGTSIRTGIGRNRRRRISGDFGSYGVCTPFI